MSAGRRVLRTVLAQHCESISNAWLDITWVMWLACGMPDIDHLMGEHVWERKA